ncbi:PO11 protein, partial [Pseudoatta argentina]
MSKLSSKNNADEERLSKSVEADGRPITSETEGGGNPRKARPDHACSKRDHLTADGGADRSGSKAWAEEKRRLNRELVLLRSRNTILERDKEERSISLCTAASERGWAPVLEWDSTMEWSGLECLTGARSPVKTREGVRGEMGRSRVKKSPVKKKKGKTDEGDRPQNLKRSALPKLRPPNSAAITLTCADPTKYQEVVGKARSSISLKDVGIEHLRPAESLLAVFADRDDVRMSRPSKTGDRAAGWPCCRAGAYSATDVWKPGTCSRDASAVAGCYFPLRQGRRKFEDALEPILVGRDFNAHALKWGSPSTDSRDDSTLLWAARHGLVLLNRGRASTFVGARGESIVDLTWATPAAAIKIRGWHVDASFLGKLSDPSGWTEELNVTEKKMGKAFARLKERPRTPGPDGIHSRVWLAAGAPIMGERLRQLYTSCLKEGSFPRSWKRARFVLLRKEGKPAESSSAYRPIFLLDDAGKLLERIIIARIVRHLPRDGPNLSRGQYDFREGLSTVDAIRQVRALSKMTAGGEVALAVSLDIMPWSQVVGAMREYHLLPPYLVAIVED